MVKNQRKHWVLIDLLARRVDGSRQDGKLGIVEK
jgi:hypothetical protein